MPRPKPPYAQAIRHFPDSRSVPPEELFQWLGYPEYAKKPEWQNTCAIRLSLALLGTGMQVPGFLHVRAGKYKGHKVEIKQAELARILTHEWGEPEKFSGALAWEKIYDRRGVIRFVQLWGPFDPQGHIDLIGPTERSRVAECAGSCFFHSVEVWFWELP